MTDTILRASNISKIYGKHKALDTARQLGGQSSKNNLFITFIELSH